MGWLDLATNAPAKFSASGMPDAPKPLEGIFVRRDAAPLSEETAAASTLRTYQVRSVTPASIAADPPRQTLRTDLLRSGYVPGSAGDRAFVAVHGGVNVYDDPALSHAENEEIFRATNIRRQRLPGSTPETYDGNLTEDEELAGDIIELAQIYGVTMDETINALERVQEDHGISLSEAVSALLSEVDDEDVPSEEEILEAVNGPRSLEAIERELHRDLIARVNEQLADARSGIRTAAEAPVGVERKSKGAPRTAGGPRPDRRFKPDGKKRKGSDGITTAPTAREHVREGTAFVRSIAEACQRIRQKRGAA